MVDHPTKAKQSMRLEMPIYDLSALSLCAPTFAGCLLKVVVKT